MGKMVECNKYPVFSNQSNIVKRMEVTVWETQDMMGALRYNVS